MFSRISLKSRMIVIGLMSLFGMLAVGGWAAWQQRAETFAERKEMLRALVEASRTQVDYYVGQEKQGLMSRKIAQERAIEGLRSARFQGSNYFFIYSYEGVTVMLPPTPEKEGESRIDLKDAKGVPLIRELIDAARKGGGFVLYDYPRAGQKEASPKIGYAYGVDEWGWLIGSGLYVDDINSVFVSNLVKAGGVVLVLAAAVFGLVFLVSRSVLKQLGGEPEEAMQTMKQIASGDLAVNVRFTGAHSMLGELDMLVRGIRELIRHISAEAEQIAAASSHILASSRSVATAAGMQADATQGMAASMEELTVSVTHISDHAAATEKYSREAFDSARDGEAQASDSAQGMRALAQDIDRAVERINGLGQRTQEVGSIALTIKDIADQTNLLALNAAIEAARAGDTGRGFAVVADEVRGLAERTTHATRDIERTLSSVLQDTDAVVRAMATASGQAGSSVNKADRSTDSLRRIASGTEYALQQVADVASAAREQSVASTALAQQVEHIAQSAEQSSQSTEATVAAANRLEQVAAGLRQAISRFRC